MRPSTRLRASGSLVALGLLSTCATLGPPFKTAKPRTLPRPRLRRLRTPSVYNSLRWQLFQFRLAAVVGDRPRVQAESGRDRRRAGGQRAADPPDVADGAEN